MESSRTAQEGATRIIRSHRVHDCLARALGIPSTWLLAQRNPTDPLPPREVQEAGTFSTPLLTPEDQDALLSLLGATLRQSRQQQRLTQRALAAKTDSTASYIGQVERGVHNVTLLHLVRLADALELSVNHLLAILDACQNPLPLSLSEFVSSESTDHHTLFCQAQKDMARATISPHTPLWGNLTKSC